MLSSTARIRVVSLHSGSLWCRDVEAVTLLRLGRMEDEERSIFASCEVGAADSSSLSIGSDLITMFGSIEQISSVRSLGCSCLTWAVIVLSLASAVSCSSFRREISPFSTSSTRSCCCCCSVACCASCWRSSWMRRCSFKACSRCSMACLSSWASRPCTSPSLGPDLYHSDDSIRRRMSFSSRLRRKCSSSSACCSVETWTIGAVG